MNEIKLLHKLVNQCAVNEKFGNTEGMAVNLRLINQLSGALALCTSHQAEINIIDKIRLPRVCPDTDERLDGKAISILKAFELADLNMKLVNFHCSAALGEFKTRQAAAIGLRRIADEVATQASLLFPSSGEGRKALA